MTFTLAQLTSPRISLGLSPRLLVVMMAALLAWTAPARADLITFGGDMSHATEGLGNFSASLSYSAISSTAATLTIALTNTTPSAGGYLTGFVLNNPGGITSVSEGSSFGNFQLLGLSSGGINAPPLGKFAFGAALGGNWLGGGSPNGGIAVGSTETFTFNLTGTNLKALRAVNFANAFNSAGYYFAARFKGMDGSGSDKVPAGPDASGGGGITASATPEPTSLIPWAAFGLGLLVYAIRKERPMQPAVQSA